MSRTGWRALLAALPDGLTAAAFAAIWLSPFVFGEAGVRTAMLVMLLEFFLIHATGFFTAFVMAPGLARGKRVAAILGLSLFYLLMIGALASSFGEWWPLLAFGWLVAAKLAWVYDEPQRVIAFGVLYFGLLCLGKLLAALFSGKEKPRPEPGSSV